MKVLSVLFVLLPYLVSAQDCNLKNEKDRYNQDPRLTTGFMKLGGGNDRFLLSVSADKKEVDFFIALDNSAMCFDDMSRAVVIFDAKQRTNYKNGGTTNCKGYFHFTFPNQENLNASLINLSNKKIVSIQFTDKSNNKKILTLRPEDQEAIVNATNCILPELEKLRADSWKPKQ